MPAVSPTYNHRRYVLQTLESVFAQTFSDYEVIVVNEGSSEDTAEVLRPVAEARRVCAPMTRISHRDRPVLSELKVPKNPAHVSPATKSLDSSTL